MHHFVRLLVTLFILAQFAGVVASPAATADAFPTAAAHAHHHHGDGSAHHHGDQGADQADHCCALHAFFAGVLPPTIAVAIQEANSQRLTPHVADPAVGVDLTRLDRPPRPQHVI